MNDSTLIFFQESLNHVNSLIYLIENAVKNSNIVYKYYTLKWLFSIWMHFKM